VAFVNLTIPGRAGSRVLLIDGEGVLLEQPPQSHFTFPVLSGISEEETEAERRYRVQAFLRLMNALGPVGKNISFISTDIGQLQLDEKIDFALFALCWYDREVCSGWVRHIAQFLTPEGRFCFIDYKLPENGLKYFVTSLISVLLKWLGEAYTLDDLKWNPKEEIGSLLKDPKYLAYYLDCIVTVSGGVK